MCTYRGKSLAIILGNDSFWFDNNSVQTSERERLAKLGGYPVGMTRSRFRSQDENRLRLDNASKANIELVPNIIKA